MTARATSGLRSAAVDAAGRVFAPATSPKTMSGSMPVTGRNMRISRLLPLSLMVLFVGHVRAEPPTAVLDFFSSAASALVEDDPAPFLDHFDRDMPEYATLRAEVDGLLAAYAASSTIEGVVD